MPGLFVKPLWLTYAPATNELMVRRRRSVWSACLSVSHPLWLLRIAPFGFYPLCELTPPVCCRKFSICFLILRTHNSCFCVPAGRSEPTYRWGTRATIACAFSPDIPITTPPQKPKTNTRANKQGPLFCSVLFTWQFRQSADPGKCQPV